MTSRSATRLANCGLLLLLWVWSPEIAVGQPQIRFEQVSWRDGLSQAAVLSMHQDRRGYLWFGTEDGLNRFDGTSFVVYRSDPDDPSSLPANFVRAIAEDANGSLWLGTEGGGVARWDPLTDRFVRYRQDSSSAAPNLASDYVRALVVDRRGDVWIGLRDSGLHRVRPASGASEHFRHDPADPTSLSGDRVTALVEGRDGDLFVGTAAGLDRFDPESSRFVHLWPQRKDVARRSDAGVHSLSEDQDGLLWLGLRGGGLVRLNPDTGESVYLRHDPADPASLGTEGVRAVLEDRSGWLWVGSEAGLELLDRRTGRFVSLEGDTSGLAGAEVLSLLQDSDGVIWVGTQLYGLGRWDPRAPAFAHHLVSHAESGHEGGRDIVTSFAEDDAGRVFVGTYGGGLVRVDRATGDVVRYGEASELAAGLSDARVMALLRDRSRRIWIGTRKGGLNRFDPVSGAFEVFRHDPGDAASLSADGVSALFEDGEGRLWVGTYGGGLNRFDPETGTFRKYRHHPDEPDSLSDDRVTFIGEAKGGRLWIGTDGGGLNLFDPATGLSKSFRHSASTAGSLPADTVLAVYVDPDGTVWVGTRGGGLAKIRMSSDAPASTGFSSYTERDGLPNAVVYAIRPDEQGGLWLSTNHGLSRFDPQRERFANFDVSHGLQANEFNIGASYRSRSGELFFGGINGYNAFHPADLLELVR